MKHLALAATFALALAALAGCGTARLPPPDPQIRTVRVEVPVVRQCPALERLGPAPAYPDTAAALTAATDIFARVALVMAGRVLRIAREVAVESALAACSGTPPPAEPHRTTGDA